MLKMWCESLLCDVCSNEAKDLKVLHCKHKLCDNCCSQFPVDTLWALICPLDKNITILRRAGRNVQDLPTLKEALNISCEECTKMSSLKNHWFCHICNNVVCSHCAMKDHRNHTCEEVDVNRLMGECISFLEPFVKKKVDYNLKIDEFCTALCQQLKSRVQSEKARSNFLTVAERHFNGVITADVSSTVLKNKGTKTKANFAKKLELVSTILSKIDSDYSIDNKVVNLIKPVKFKRKFPNIVQIADLFFNFSVKDNPLPATLKPNPADSGISPIHCDVKKPSSVEKIQQPMNITVKNGQSCDTKTVPIAQAKQTKNVVVNNKKQSTSSVQPVKTPKKVEINKKKQLNWQRSKKLDLSSPTSLCAIPNFGVALINQNNVYLYSVKLNVGTLGLGLPVNNSSDFQHKPAIAYHSTRNSIFVLKEVDNDKTGDGKKILEFKIPSLKPVQALAYPPFNDKDRRLLGVLSNGDILCASSSAMINIDPKRIRSSRIVWARLEQSYEPFEDMVIQKNDSKNSSIYVMAASDVYVFLLPDNAVSAKYIKKIKVNNSWPFVIIENKVYGLNSKQKALEAIGENDSLKNITVSDCKLLDGSIVEMSSTERIVYMLHCRSKSLYKGCIE